MKEDNRVNGSGKGPQLGKRVQSHWKLLKKEYQLKKDIRKPAVTGVCTFLCVHFVQPIPLPKLMGQLARTPVPIYIGGRGRFHKIVLT